MTREKNLEAYAAHSPWSDPGPAYNWLRSVPPNASDICNAVQGVLIHDYFGEHLYADPPANIAEASRETLPIHARIAQIQSTANLPLTHARPEALRSVGTCRDFALLSAAIWRAHGIPARVRCGFAQYFHPPSYEDHWICQYWDAQQNVWVSMDAELDAAHCTHLGIDFDPTNLPKDAFLFPWQVWRLHREQLEQFGHGDATGAWFVWVNLGRDLLALCGEEVSNWDTWRMVPARFHDFDAQSHLSCDALADAGRSRDHMLFANELDTDLVKEPFWA